VENAVVYDKLLINEHQKKDNAFVMDMSLKTALTVLRGRVIVGTVVENFVELNASGLSPNIHTYFQPEWPVIISIRKCSLLWTQNCTELSVLMKLMRQYSRQIHYGTV